MGNSIIDRVCVICGEVIPNSQAVFHPRLRLIYHNKPECRNPAEFLDRDYSKSKCGRKRTRKEVQAMLRNGGRPWETQA